MKTQISTLIFFLLSIVSADASVDLAKYQKVITEINSLEQSKQFHKAAIVSAIAANEISEGVGIDAVVASVDNYFHENREEVVTNKSAQSAGFSILFGMLGGSAHRDWDMAGIITTNPEEVSGFFREEAKSFQNLQKNLVFYFKENELAIFYAKIFAAKALQLTGRVADSEMQTLFPLTSKTALRIARISFLGVQNVKSCTTTQYANRSRSEGFAITGILALHLSESEQQFAHSETTCSERSNSAVITESDILMGKLFVADLALRTESKILSFRQMAFSTTPDYPTWGSSYYK